MCVDPAITGKNTVPLGAVILPAGCNTVPLPPNISAPQGAAAFTPGTNGFTDSANVPVLKK